MKTNEELNQEILVIEVEAMLKKMGLVENEE